MCVLCVCVCVVCGGGDVAVKVSVCVCVVCGGVTWP